MIITMTYRLQLPLSKDHGLESADPHELLKVRDKTLKDMGKDNFDLSAC